jgi:CheY-like chemotaxis protein
MSDSCQIVIAEDNPADVLVVRMALEEAVPGFNLKVFEDGESILTYVDELEQRGGPCPDVMLLDLNMPKAGGLEVMQRLRRGTAWLSTPVIIITSSSRPKDREEALALGAAHYFLKPDDFNDFLKIGDVVKETLQRREGEYSLGAGLS